jgi:hypothetical protein
MTLSAKQIEAVLRLPGPKRFEHFVKVVADTEAAWGLWKNGWTLMSDDGGQSALPLLPAREYAQLLIEAVFPDHEARELSLEEVMAEVVPTLQESNILVAVFPTPSGKGVLVQPDELSDALQTELARYE